MCKKFDLKSPRKEENVRTFCAAMLAVSVIQGNCKETKTCKVTHLVYQLICGNIAALVQYTCTVSKGGDV